jgi:hypothetical protein
MNRKYVRMTVAAAAALILVGCVSVPGNHPAYLNALEDLRSARWMIEHRPGDWVRSAYEVDAVRQIEWAIYEINRAAIADGKDINWHPAVDESPDRAGRLHAALLYLDKARSDVAQDEDNFFASGLRNRAIGGIDGAIKSANSALID